MGHTSGSRLSSVRDLISVLTKLKRLRTPTDETAFTCEDRTSAIRNRTRSVGRRQYRQRRPIDECCDSTRASYPERADCISADDFIDNTAARYYPSCYPIRSSSEATSTLRRVVRLNGDTVSTTKIMFADMCVHIQRGYGCLPIPLR